ncbi:unnamed protein product, partial [Nippostrongylus brasiliensis]|uniref:Ovule protein n=1 Tax=Nippostrongylus brasiliensis TaxID=27835 RepID=A0A0N4YVP2_NIPBR
FFSLEEPLQESHTNIHRSGKFYFSRANGSSPSSCPTSTSPTARFRNRSTTLELFSWLANSPEKNVIVCI